MKGRGAKGKRRGWEWVATWTPFDWSSELTTRSAHTQVRQFESTIEWSLANYLRTLHGKRDCLADRNHIQKRAGRVLPVGQSSDPRVCSWPGLMLAH